ncbi:MAG: TIGR03960 family B12-binding radical SAM protein [Candidatus Cloacimonetes bacterium]|nr:TIGR03960 family B12-binding radical SAM protein [Candidatus Cloacimonadota bacterium]
MSFKKIQFQHLLASVLKPARYINQELNSYGKHPSDKTVNFCLAFPDVYEVGFSHLGLKILYSILNKEPDCVADRVYAPWPDFAELLKEENIPLFGIESTVALKDFDMIGFTLQTELTYTNVLYMLDLTRIPLLSSERQETDPIIFAGGPSAANPQPMADFFDGFLIGDGEEAILEIKNCLKETQNSSRQKKLESLSQIERVYIPVLYDKQQGKIKARKFMDFDNLGKTHDNQLVPWMMPTHYRYVSEIMRGCSRGCRFCFAGMFYRPVRERDPEVILKNLLEEVKKYGWSEVALTSLSSSDYSCIKPLLMEIYKNLDKASLSLPSLRVDSIDDELTTLMNAMRQTGLTIAPEAGSQRLRNIINKNISQEEILRSVEIALKNGWQLIKFYFMIGLPFETEEDIEAIIKLINDIIQFSKKKLRINITISPFVPKPFTPFQWVEMENKDELLRKAKWIKNAFGRYKFIKIKYHDVESSLLECVMGRGGREVGKLILQAYKNGAVFDGWDEYFNFRNWETAASETGIDLASYTKSIPPESELPWQNIDLGISEEFLLAEWKKSESAETTEDCKTGKCTDCGVCTKDVFPKYVEKIHTEAVEIREPVNDNSPNIHYRVFFGKMGKICFVPHLDLARMIYNIMRASGLPIAYSQGFNVRPILSFGPPLPLGVQGRNEYFDFILKEEMDTKFLYSEIAKVIPPQLELNNIEPVPLKAMRAMNYYVYEKASVIPPAEFAELFEKETTSFQNCSELLFTRIRKEKERTVDLKEIVQTLNWTGEKLEITKKMVGANIFDVLEQVYKIERNKTNRFEIIREELIPLNLIQVWSGNCQI